MPKPRKVFIGSSRKYIKLAQALRMTFQHEGAELDVQVWDLTPWKDGYDNLTSLIEFLDQFQFGVFLLTPDDTVSSSAHSASRLNAPRDNVILELGMWFGRAGRDRTWFVVPRNVEIKTPTDLLGINPIRYEHPNDQDYEAKSVTELKNLFGNAHDSIKGNIAAYQKRAVERNFFDSHIRHIQLVLKTAGEDEAIRMLRDGLGFLLLERAAVSHMSLSDTLSNILFWTKSLLDGLDTDQLAEEQNQQFSEIWVFAPEPLETVPGRTLNRIRETVIQNLFDKRVPYRYFVDSEKNRNKILEFLKDAGRGRGDVEQILKEKVKFDLLPEESFLSYFTVHFCQESYTVYQSMVCDNRDDFILKVDPSRARTVKKLIDKLALVHASQGGRTRLPGGEG